MRSTVVLNFKSLPQAQVAEFAANVIDKMSNDAQFISLMPQVGVLKTVYEAYQVAVSKSNDGGKSATLEKNNKLDELKYQLSSVARYVDVLANERESVVWAAGYETRKKAVPVTALSTPTNLVATNVELIGAANLSWGSVLGTTIYAIERRVKGTEIWFNGEYRSACSATIEDLDSNVTIEFRVIAINGTGIKSNWSQFVEVLVS